jgi:hypothetical protein
VHHGNQTREINVFDITQVGPSLASRRHSFGEHAFAVEATDGITAQKARPMRRHKLLRACGFENGQVTALMGQDIQWDDTFNRLKETAPAHSWEPLLAALYSAGAEEATAETTRLCCTEIDAESVTDPKRHYADSKAFIAVAETEELLTKRNEQHGKDASAFTLTHEVIN